jgi:hypothetical protein
VDIYAIVMLMLCALALNAIRLHTRYNLAGLTTFLGWRDWYFDGNSQHLVKSRNPYGWTVHYNGLTVWSFLFIPVAVRGFNHSTAVHD